MICLEQNWFMSENMLSYLWHLKLVEFAICSVSPRKSLNVFPEKIKVGVDGRSEESGWSALLSRQRSRTWILQVTSILRVWRIYRIWHCRRGVGCLLFFNVDWMTLSGRTHKPYITHSQVGMSLCQLRRRSFHVLNSRPTSSCSILIFSRGFPSFQNQYIFPHVQWYLIHQENIVNVLQLIWFWKIEASTTILTQVCCFHL